jgi:hypothetical protein
MHMKICNVCNVELGFLNSESHASHDNGSTRYPFATTGVLLERQHYVRMSTQHRRLHLANVSRKL